MAQRPDDREFQPHSAHWGAFSAGMRDGRLVVLPHPGDPDPNGLLQNFPEALRHKAIVGPGDAVAARLTELAGRLALEELVVVTWTHDPAARHRSYELLAAAIHPP